MTALAIAFTALLASGVGAVLSPMSKHVEASIADGKATFHLKPYDKAWVSFDDNAKSTTIISSTVFRSTEPF